MNLEKSFKQDDHWIDIHYNNAWWGDPEPDWAKVKEKLKRHYNEAAKQLKRDNNVFVFIRFNVHPKHEASIITDMKDSEGHFLTTVNGLGLPVVVHFPFRFSQPTKRYLLNEKANQIEFLRQNAEL